jgi:hypothetical protein
MCFPVLVLLMASAALSAGQLELKREMNSNPLLLSVSKVVYHEEMVEIGLKIEVSPGLLNQLNEWGGGTDSLIGFRILYDTGLPFSDHPDHPDGWRGSLPDLESDVLQADDFLLSSDYSATVHVDPEGAGWVRFAVLPLYKSAGWGRISHPTSAVSLRNGRTFTAGTISADCGDLQAPLPVTIDLADDLLSFQFRLYYDDVALTFINAQVGPVFSGWSISYFTGSDAQGAFVNVASFSISGIASGTGSAEMASARFDVAQGACDQELLPIAFNNNPFNMYSLSDFTEHQALLADGDITVDCPANQPPGSVVNLLPGNGAIDQPVSLTIDWLDTSGANSYNLYLDTANPPVQKVASGLKDSRYDQSGLLFETTYFWKVEAYHTGNLCPASEGPVWSFTTLTPALGPMEVPDDSLRARWQDSSVVLTWGETCGAANYYTIYEGDADLAFRQGVFNHISVECFDEGGDFQEIVVPRNLYSYFLIVPRTVTGVEGGYGFGRPQGVDDAGCGVSGFLPEVCP